MSYFPLLLLSIVVFSSLNITIIAVLNSAICHVDPLKDSLFCLLFFPLVYAQFPSLSPPPHLVIFWGENWTFHITQQLGVLISPLLIPRAPCYLLDYLSNDWMDDFNEVYFLHDFAFQRGTVLVMHAVTLGWHWFYSKAFFVCFLVVTIKLSASVGITWKILIVGWLLCGFRWSPGI